MTNNQFPLSKQQEALLIRADGCQSKGSDRLPFGLVLVVDELGRWIGSDRKESD